MSSLQHIASSQSDYTVSFLSIMSFCSGAMTTGQIGSYGPGSNPAHAPQGEGGGWHPRCSPPVKLDSHTTRKAGSEAFKRADAHHLPQGRSTPIESWHLLLCGTQHDFHRPEGGMTGTHAPPPPVDLRAGGGAVGTKLLPRRRPVGRNWQGCRPSPCGPPGGAHRDLRCCIYDMDSMPLKITQSSANPENTKTPEIKTAVLPHDKLPQTSKRSISEYGTISVLELPLQVKELSSKATSFPVLTERSIRRIMTVLPRSSDFSSGSDSRPVLLPSRASMLLHEEHPWEVSAKMSATHINRLTENLLRSVSRKMTMSKLYISWFCMTSRGRYFEG